MITLTVLLILVALVVTLVLASPVLLDAAIAVLIIIGIIKIFRRKG